MIIFSIDHEAALQDRFTVNVDGTVYTGSIEWDYEPYYTLIGCDGNEAPEHVSEDDYVLGGFNEIVGELAWCDYTGRQFEALKPTGCVL